MATKIRPTVVRNVNKAARQRALPAHDDRSGNDSVGTQLTLAQDKSSQYRLRTDSIYNDSNSIHHAELYEHLQLTEIQYSHTKGRSFVQQSHSRNELSCRFMRPSP